MKRTITFCMICFLSVTYLFAENPVIRYYKQIKIVTKDRKEQAGSGSGQFIAFNDNGCYDCDKSGYTVNNGFLKFGKSTADRVYYSGYSYWGEAMYIFTENYGRLNIVVEDSGITYVYALATPPANVYTCALIKEKDTDSTNTDVVVTPIPPVNPNINTGKTTTTRTPTAKQKYVTKEETCHICYGSGKCSTCNGKGYVISTYTQKYDNCVNCTNGRCSKCSGSGKVLKGRYETVYE